jgi:hypothetical protein
MSLITQAITGVTIPSVTATTATVGTFKPSKTVVSTTATNCVLGAFNASDISKVEALSSAATKPIGVIDSGTSTTANRSAVFYILGATPGTILITADGAITAGSVCYTTNTGAVSSTAPGSGQYYAVGVAVTTVADGEKVEVATQAATTVLGS